jgi:hypothetical protein
MDKKPDGRINRHINKSSEDEEEFKDYYGAAPEEWKKFYDEFTDTRTKLLTLVFGMKDAKRKRELLDRIGEKQRASFASVEDTAHYVAMHRAVSGGTGPISSPKLDFDGEHSLLKFYAELLAEIEV